MKTKNPTPNLVDTLFVNEFTNGLLDPAEPMLGPVRSGGYIVANTSPCCWGPMITPSILSGHEPTWPVAVDGAEIGDAVAIRIKDITVTSLAGASGVHQVIEGRDEGDPFMLAKCPECGTLNPETVIEGTGEDAVRCAHCGAATAPFKIAHCYSIVFDSTGQIGVTLPQDASTKIAEDPHRYSALPENSKVNPFLAMAPSHMPGVVARLRPFMGQLGTIPGVKMSSMHNAGDAMSRLVNATHKYGVQETALQQRTDAHMDSDAVREGVILVCPVKVPGAGIYTGDMHAMQGDGEIAGHTVDVSGTVTFQVELIKGLSIDGPILFPLVEDLPYLAQPLTVEEQFKAQSLAIEWEIDEIEEAMPISIIGSGENLNEATSNGLERAAKVLNINVNEVKNRATITGAIEIARLAGVVQVTFLAPLDRLDAIGLGSFAREQYG